MRKDDPRRKDAIPRSAGTLFRRRVRQSWPDDRDFRILSIDGGGIRGILPLAMLAGLEKRHLGGRSIASYFDLITGTSTGGIIALGLARGLTASELLEIYIKRGSEVFPDHWWIVRTARSALQLVANRCKTEALYKLIDEIVGTRQLWESQVRLCVPAAETRHFEPCIFKTPHHPDYRKDWKETMAHVAKTTSAAPAHFKPVVSPGGLEFIDGGIWANNPVMIGVADALACFDMRREQIKVLTVGCGKTKYEMTGFRRALGGKLSWTNLIFEAMDIQSQNVIGQARLICGGDNVLRLDAMMGGDPIELWDWARAKDELPAIAAEVLDTMGSLPANMFLHSASASFSPCYDPRDLPAQPLTGSHVA